MTLFFISIDLSGLVSAQQKEEEVILILKKFCKLKLKMGVSVDGSLPEPLCHRKSPFL